MTKKDKQTCIRYIISTIETFIVAFIGSFLFMLENLTSAGQINGDILKAAAVGGIIAGLKAVSKIIRENFFPGTSDT